MTHPGSRGKSQEWIYDELLNYVASPLFQVPVLSFMESNCLIFDPSIEDCKEYRELHGAYCALVTVLLDAFRQDTNLKHEQVIQAMTEMSKKDDIREVFSGLFEQILATEYFKLFVRLMINKNLDLQQQALVLIMKQYGNIPDIMKPANASPSAQQQQTSHKKSSAPEVPVSDKKSASADSKPATAAASKFNHVQQQEEEIMQSIMKATSSTKVAAPSAQEETYHKTEVDKVNQEKQKEQEKLVQVMRELTFQDLPPPSSSKQADSKSSLPQVSSAPPPTPSEPQAFQSQAAGGDAAAQWIAQAKAESAPSAAVQSAAESLSSLSADDLKKRQQFLKEQREKLAAMKQKEREKQLSSYEQKTPSRPKSARVARSVLSRAPQPEPEDPKKKEDEKTMEMRRAIASRLRAEVIGSQQF